MAQGFSLEEALGNGAQQTKGFSLEEAIGAPQRKSTIGSEIVRGGKQLVSSARTGIEALIGSPEEAALAGIERGRSIGEEAGEGVSLEALKRAYEQRGLLSATGEAISQIPRALAGQVPQLAAMAGSAKLGAMAGTAIAPGVGTIAGGVLGAGASLLPQFFGSNVERQASEQLEKNEPVKIDRASAGAAAAGQAAIEGAGTAFVLGKRIVKGVLGVADDAALATTKAQQSMTKAAERSLAAAAMGGAARGVATEIPVEIAQSVIERAQAGLDVTSPEALSEYGEVAYQAGLVGGAIGGGAGPVNTAMARQGVKARTAFEEAEAKRVAEEEQARLEAEAEEKAKIPPLALGAEGVFTPVVLPDGSVAMTREDLAQYEEQQFKNKYAAQEADKKPSLALGVSEPFKPVVFPDGSVATTPEEVAAYEQQQFESKYRPQALPPQPVFVEEPVGKPITGAAPSLGATPAGGDLAGIISGRREAEEAKAEVPLTDDYAFLQREKQRLKQQEQTPETKKLIGRIDERLDAIVMRDVENMRMDKQRAAGSAFAQETLPPVESRDVVVGGEELAKLQAQERFPETAIDRKEKQSLARLEKLREQPAPPESDADEKLAQLEKERSKIKSTNLYGELMGKLAPGEVSDISPDIGKNLRIKGNRGGAFISDIVSSGLLDNYLPPDKRPGSITFDESEAAEYIKEKLRNKDNLTFDAGIQARQLDDQIASMRKEAVEPRTAEYEVSDIEPGEAASVERSALEKDVVDATDIRYKRATGKVGIGKQSVQDIVDAVKARWSNAPEVVVAESMDDAVIPQEVRDHNAAAVAKGAKGSPQGFYYKGKAYVIADAIGSTNDAVEALMHEALGHFGLRGVFGPKMEAVLRDVIKNRRAEVESKAKQYGLDPKNDKDMLEAAEEVLAVMAQTKPGLPFVKRAIAIIRNFLRDIGFNVKMTDADIIQKYILPARAFVESGKGRPAEGKPAATREAPSSIPAGLTGIGYKLIPRGDERRFKGFGTWEKDGVRVALSGDLLIPERGTVQKYYSDDEAMTIEAIITDPSVRGQGRARKAMQDIIRFANETGKDLYLEPVQLEKSSGLNRKQLTDFYRGLGFEPTDSSGLVMAKKAKPAASREAGVRFYEDIPNEDWLQGKIDYALETPPTKFGIPRMSSQTGYFNRPVLVPVSFFDGVKGQRGEQDNVRQESLSAIRKIIRETGKMPLLDDGTEYVPYVEVAYNGKPYISEGNHRIMAAIAEGFEYIPVQLRYFDGGQRRAGKWGPENLKEITDRQEGEAKPAAMRGEAPKTGPESEAFKRWFGNSKVVDADGKPLVVYTGTSKDFDFSKFKIPKNGAWFTGSPEEASAYAKENDSMGFEWEGGRPVEINTASRVMPVYLKIENPYTLTAEEKDTLFKSDNYKRAQGVIFERAKARGFDGVDFGNGIWVVIKEPAQIKSAIGNIGTYDPRKADIRYSRDSITGKPILAQWGTPTDTKLAGDIGKDDLIYSLQNKMIDTKRVVDAISATAGKIAAKWNPYLQEELYHGRTAKQTKDLLTEELRPLMQAMDKAGVNIADMETYLKNRHAIAYNAQVAKVNPKMPDGGSGIKTADAQKYLSSLSPADKAKYEALAKRVDSITKGTRNILVDSGLETKEVIKNWEATFPFYVPLKRDDIDYAYTAGGMGTGQGFDVRGSFSRRAMGSEREATDVLANIAMMRERAIVKAQKNRVAQALFGLAAQNPNPEFWLPVDPLAEVNPENMQELMNFGLSKEDLDFIAKEPRQKAIDKNKNEVVERINATLRNNENVLSMRFGGENRYVFFNPNDPRAKRMAASLKNLDADQLGHILGPISKITRWMAAVNTQYNPIFGAYNFLRDVQGATLQLSTTPLANETKAVVGGTLPALKGIYSALRAERDGVKATGEWAKLWQEFQEEGGQTGFRDQFSRSQERAEALQDELNKIKEGKLKAAGRATFNWLSDYNDAMENAVRLSAYKAALDKGIGKEEAASIAKNLTVNFNRKGQIGVQAGALYAFFNAAMQGTTRLVQTLRGPAGKKIMAGGFLLGTMQAALLAAAGFDDEEPPEFVRERNLILPIGGDKYIAFPMPLGYHVIPSTSRILTEWALSGFKDTPDRIASLTGMFLEAFNPIGNAGWSAQTLAPTFADPIVALTENRDWTGKPIARKDFSSLDPTPGYTRAKDTASEFSTQIAKFLNYASGGTEFKPGVLSPTPDQIDYLIGQATGGLGREILKAEQTVVKTATGEELPPYKIPLVGRFYGETKSSAAESSRFYKNLTELNEHENEIKGLRASKQPTAEYMKENPEARLAPLARKTYSEIQKLRKRKEQLLERDAPRESIKQVEEMITKRMQALNARVEALKE
jgi:GNAT superfamily N-acetyltransferase